jgi:ferredoxin-NADP reductase/predicted pyridoxine 5'-phosphate oxidase superfamily flavin-nucleotide-binding protein
MDTVPAKLPTWHEGEIALQEKVGVVEHMAAIGQRVIRDYMPDQHRDFYAQLPFIVLGSVDDQNDAWATFMEGHPGFISSPTPTILDVGASVDPRDPAHSGLSQGKPVGLLGIEMHTRRRNRMNGFVSATAGGFRIDVDQSFGNCPRYIQRRDFNFAGDPGKPTSGGLEELAGLDDEARAVIEAADTFFVASYVDRDDRRQVDVSHRGGNAGFVRVGNDGVLTIPDFDGNLFFSTLGNIFVNGKAGLLFVDFATGDMLQMTGDAAVILDSPEITAFQGAERLWTVKPRRIVRRREALALRWAFQADGWSPNSLMTGSWTQAADRLKARGLTKGWRPLKVTRIVEESATIRSFHFQSADDTALWPHVAGQHLPIRLTVPGHDRPLHRTYTLSVAPSDEFYRISVKRDGAVSQFLHDTVAVGDIIEARAPAGAFTIDAREARPAVLLAGGVGITPLVAMLRHVVFEGIRRQKVRPITLLHAVRTKADRAFEKEIAELAAAAKGAVRVLRVQGDIEGVEQEADYDVAGRIDMALLSRVLAFHDYDFYLCGPPQFTQTLYDGLRGYNIADARIHSEMFGPSSLKRSTDGTGKATMLRRAPPSDKPVPVVFTNSLKEARWTPGSGTLLDLAEARDLQPDFSCREGNCGTCRTKLVKGAVTYVKEPAAEVDEDEVLLCCAVPASQEGGVQLAV